MITVNINASKNYDILIGKGLLDRCGELISQVEKSKKCAIVTDDIVDGLYGRKTVENLERSGFTV